MRKRPKQSRPELVRWLCAALLCAVTLVFLGVVVTHRFDPTKPHLALSTVLVSDDVGHGSGVHIGSGFILTAAHVVEGHDRMTVTDSEGSAQSGTVLWVNKAYDVALVQVDQPAGIGSAELNCSAFYRVGDEIRAVGSPAQWRFVSTWGHIAALVEQRSDWKLAFLADIAVAPGMSGGPIFDRLGKVIGLTVGVSLTQIGFSSSLYGISIIVPARSVCLLLAEARR